MFDSKLLVAAPLLAILTTGAAHAALSADDMWSQVQARATEAGLTLKAVSQKQDGDTLTLTTVTLVEADGETVLSLSDLSLVEQDDGSLAFVPGEISLGDTGSGTITISHKDLAVLVFEDEAGLGYGIAADALKVQYKDDMTDENGRSAFDTAVDLTNLAGRYTRGTEELGLSLTSDQFAYATAEMSEAMDFSRKQTSETKEISLTGALKLPKGGLDLTTLAELPVILDAVQNGLALSLMLDQGASNSTSEDQNEFMPITATVAMEPGHTMLDINKEAFDFMTHTDGMVVNLTTPAFEGPAEVSTGTFAMGLKSPIIATEAPGDYGLSLELAQLKLGAPIWKTVDPENKLDHGPAEVKLDLSGQAKMDLLSMAMESEGSGEMTQMPEVLSLNLNEIMIKLAGAALTGTGAFTFDNSGVETGGVPVPVGKASFTTQGANRLIEALQALGVLSEDDVAGARMMLMMFGAPVEGKDDTLTSDIEAKANGEILVNGQRVQ